MGTGERRIIMHGENISYAYGFWSLVAVNVGLFAFFLLSFLTPFKKREWRSMGATLAFFVALFTEMYGFPLTIYILTGILGSNYPALNPFSPASGHLWLVVFGGGQTMMTVIHIISNGLALIGFIIMGKGWSLIHGTKGGLVMTGPYAYVRHPQYSGLFLIMIGMLIQWPTIITALMFPALIYVYYRLSKREKAEMVVLFGDEYRLYREKTPMFVPKWGGKDRAKAAV
jgi:protein-S-isoprenylcysteine O-methyltransferase Ste14